MDIPPVKSCPQNVTTREKEPDISVVSRVLLGISARWGLGYTGIHSTVADIRQVTMNITA